MADAEDFDSDNNCSDGESEIDSALIEIGFSRANKPTTNSREAFFANYESDELTTYESNLRNLKRRFPGPAGLLPKLTSSEVECLNDADHPLSQQISKIIVADLIQKQPQADEILTPERGILRMNKAPWRELIKELDLNPKDPKDLLNLMNIQWVKRKIFRHPATTKIPFLALVVQEDPDGYRSQKKVTGRQKNPSIKFMDPTGTIFAAMDGKFVENYGVNLVPGTAIAVKNSGFLRFRRQIILTITQKNVICMTSMKQNEEDKDSGKKPTKRRKSDESESIENVAEVSKPKEKVGVLHFSDFNLAKTLQDYESILTAKIDDESRSEDTNSTNPSTNRAAMYSTVRTTTPFQAPLRSPMTSVPKTVQVSKPEDFSVFCDDDDDELMQALDNVDFLMEESSSSAVDLV